MPVMGNTAWPAESGETISFGTDQSKFSETIDDFIFTVEPRCVPSRFI